MPERTLIIAVSILFALSALFLFWQNERELDPDQGKNWWILSFAAPEQAGSLSFTVENHSDQEAFSYAIARDKDILLEDAFSVERGETITIDSPFAAATDVRTKITVSTGNEKKDIYR